MLSKRGTLLSLFMICLILILGILIEFKFNVADLTEKAKCPACYGISMCQDIHDNKINFDLTNFYSIFNIMFGVKNVYYGYYKNKKVVMKKLARKSELDAFDSMICTFTDMNKSCSRGKQVNFNALIMSELNNYNMTDPHVKMRLCPTIEKINNLLVHVNNPSRRDGDYLKYLWTTLKINPEPIILQILNAHDNWPTPKYFGACGRLIIVEFIGPQLSEFYTEPWIKRAKIASSLLDAAHSLTFKNKEFAFYLTDISMDNIAVNEQDQAIFVDLENIILVDKNPSEKVTSNLDSWNEIHTNNIDIDCLNCFVFSPLDICEHKISDHNYYAICQHILTQNSGTESTIMDHGFLHNPPMYILEKYPMLKLLLVQCSISNSRIDSGIKLKQLLDIIIQDTNNYK